MTIEFHPIVKETLDPNLQLELTAHIYADSESARAAMRIADNITIKDGIDA
ncbi:10901_t:CDS:1 [Dentiscutata heterogama]|uniref:10901_t:CDS:1 n=1 Tax=Dentiscutata heterogama TaxID=1316150 RepID=A0ACA9Q761_9GLOM|nr:10901_t:CDS:1 [Dentiscutata heterogama]